MPFHSILPKKEHSPIVNKLLYWFMGGFFWNAEYFQQSFNTGFITWAELSEIWKFLETLDQAFLNVLIYLIKNHSIWRSQKCSLVFLLKIFLTQNNIVPIRCCLFSPRGSVRTRLRHQGMIAILQGTVFVTPLGTISKFDGNSSVKIDWRVEGFRLSCHVKIANHCKKCK